MNLNENHQLIVTGPDVDSVLNAIKGEPFTHPDYHTVHDVHIDPQRIIPAPEGADDAWRLEHWGTRQVLLDSQRITRRETGRVDIYFSTFRTTPTLLLLKLSTMFPDHVFALFSVEDCDDGYVTPSKLTFTNGHEVERVDSGTETELQHVYAAIDDEATRRLKLYEERKGAKATMQETYEMVAAYDTNKPERPDTFDGEVVDRIAGPAPSP